MLLLVACQTNDASENEKTEVQIQEGKSEPQSVKVAYQLQQGFPMTIQVTSTSIKHTGYLKKDFTCEGGISGSGNLPEGALEGTNGYGGTGWKGPCPPPRVIAITQVKMLTPASENTGITSPVYQINVYALDTEVLASAGADREEVLRQIDGHVIAGGFISTKYLSSIVIRK